MSIQSHGNQQVEAYLCPPKQSNEIVVDKMAVKEILSSKMVKRECKIK